MYVVARRAGTIKTLASWLSRYDDRLHHVAVIIVTTTSFEKSQICVNIYPKPKEIISSKKQMRCSYVHMCVIYIFFLQNPKVAWPGCSFQ